MLKTIGLIGLLSIGTVQAGMSCPLGETAAQKLGRRLESNGCTKPAFLTVQGEEDFTYCCDRHDVCYSTCGLTHSFCDEDFKKCMHSLCDQIFPHNPECKSAASTYSMGTSMFGAELYANEQKDNCVCVKSDDLIPHYIKYVSDFYNLFVPADQAKDPSDIFTKSSKYLKNSGSETSPVYKNINRVVYDLHKKYDNAIRHTETRKSKGSSIPKPPTKKEL